MKVYDCFLFSNELDLLRLRLEYLDEAVDFFVLVESPRTLANSTKQLFYLESKHLFEKFNHKIIHIVTEKNDLPAWEYEFFQRNSIKLGLTSCADDDIVFISDVDEFVNIKEVLRQPIAVPTLIELSMYYYFLNFKVGTKWIYNLVAPYHQLKNLPIGDRNTYQSFAVKTLFNFENKLGWHFSYLFGTDIEAYKTKVRSFSHQEFNTPYFLDSYRIDTCIRYGIDLFERPYKFTNDPSPLQWLRGKLAQELQAKWIYIPNRAFEVKAHHLYWLFRMKIINRLVNAIRNRIFKKRTI